MAKTKASTEVKAAEPQAEGHAPKAQVVTAQGQKVLVGAGMEAVEVLALDEKGANLVFDYEEGFLALKESDVRALSRDNAYQYALSVGAHRGWLKQKSAAGPTPGLRIMDPLGGMASEKLKFLKRDGKGGRLHAVNDWKDPDGKSWHGCWKRPDEVAEAEEYGYVKITQEGDANIVTRGASSVSETRVIRRKDGTDDLVAMKLPSSIYEEHIQAVALKSAQNAGTPLKELREKLKAADRRLEVMDTSTTLTTVVTSEGERVVGEE